MKKNETAAEVPKPRSSASQVTPDLIPCPDANGRPLESWARSNTTVLEGAVELAHEILVLTQVRVQADCDAWKALTDCRNPSNFLDHQKAFAEKATAQYFDEATKIESKMAGVLNKVTTQFPEQDTAT